MKKSYNAFRFFFLMVGFVVCTERASAQCASIITTILGTGTGGNGSSGGAATSTAINVPWGVGADAAGNVYVCDFMNHKIRKVSPSGIVTDFAGTGASGYTGNGGPATAAKISAPSGLAVYGTDVYFVDLGNQRVRKINAAGIISVVAGNGTSGYSGDGGQATAASIDNPNGLCIDASGNIYIPDQNTRRVRKVNTSGIISTVAGNGTIGSGGDGGPATAAQLGLANGVTVDGAGNLFISDYSNHKIRKVSAGTGIITTYAGTGSAGLSGDGGPATAAMISGPAGLDIDNAGNLLIGDADNYRVRKVDAATGIITTVAGTDAGYSGDGGAPDVAQLNRPHRISCDAGGNIYISDVENDVVRKITSTSSAVITGTSVVCVGSTTTLTSSISGGTWSSSNTAKATVNTTTGVVTGVSTGTVDITYTLSGGCSSSIEVTVNSIFAGDISGLALVCVGSTITHSHTLPGGVWSSSNPAIATVGSSTGIVTGISAGTPTISYTLGGCSRIKKITVSVPSGASITGATTICENTASVLSYPAYGTSWTSSDLTVATIGITSGLVTGISPGTSLISYLGTTGCGTSVVVTILPQPTAISGTLTVCKGATTALASIGTTGGTWVSTVLSKAIVGSASGIVSGVNAGTSNITYTWTNGCKRSAQVTVNPLPIPGVVQCLGSTIVHTGSTPTRKLTATGGEAGGVWTSSNAVVMAVTTTASNVCTVTALSAGAANITYTVTNGCGTTFNKLYLSVVSPRTGEQLAGAEGVTKFSVYPNPTSGALNIEAPVTGTFTIYSIDSRQVVQQAITDAVTKLTLPQNLAAGIYMCRFSGDDGNITMVRLVYEP